MTKADLLEELKTKEVEISQFENDIDYWIAECDILRGKLDDLESVTVDPILDSDDFKFRLSLDGLLTPELEQFICDYIKFYQEAV